MRIGFLASFILILMGTVSFGIDFSGFVDSAFSYIEKNNNSILTNVFWSYPNYSFCSILKISAKGDNFSVVSRVFVDYVSLTNSFYLDEVYVDFDIFDLVSFKVGRQIVGFGIGYLWNPVNGVDIPKNLFSMDKYRVGVDAIKINFDFSKFTRIPFSFSTFLLLPIWETNSKFDLSYSKVGVYSYVFINPVEFGFASSYQKLTNDREDISFGIFGSVDLLGSIVGMEISASRRNNVSFINQDGKITNSSDFLVEGLVSFNRRVSEKSFLVLEYYYNNFGFSGEEVDSLFNTLETNIFILNKFYSRFTPGNLSKNNVFLGVSWEVFENLGISINVLGNLDRLGMLLYPLISYSIGESFDVAFEMAFNIGGEKKSEISEAIYRSFYNLRFVGYF